MVWCCNLWTRLRVSYAALFDPGLSGFIGNFTRQTFDVLRLLCELNLIVFAMMVSVLKPVYVRRFRHSWYQSRTKRAPENAMSFRRNLLKF